MYTSLSLASTAERKASGRLVLWGRESNTNYMCTVVGMVLGYKLMCFTHVLIKMRCLANMFEKARSLGCPPVRESQSGICLESKCNLAPPPPEIVMPCPLPPKLYIHVYASIAEWSIQSY